MTRLLAALLLAAVFGASGPAHADLDESVASYEAGRYDEAFDGFSGLAADGDGTAMYYLARMYEEGQGASQSRPIAFTWYRRAAANDNAEAAFRLGEMYEDGIGVPRNYAAAANAYQAAADLGHAGATIALADLYVDGAGAMPDPSRAARLLHQTAAGGSPEAQAALDELVASGAVPRGVLDELGIQPPPPPKLPTVEELAAEELADQASLLTESEPGATQSAGLQDSEIAMAVGETAQSAPEALDESQAASRLREVLPTLFPLLAPGALGSSEFSYALDISDDDGLLTATLRGTRFTGGALAAGIWEVGDVVMTLQPIGAERYDTTVLLPASTIFYDTAGNEAGGTTIGDQNLTGVVDLAAGTWTTYAWGVGDVVVEARPLDAPVFAMTLGSLGLDGTLEESPAGKWTGPTIGTAGELSVTMDGVEVFAIGSLSLRGSVRAYDMAFFQALDAAQQAFDAEFGVAADVQDPAVQLRMQSLFAPLIDMARERAPLMGDMGMDIEMRDISALDPMSGETFSVDRVRLASAAADFDAPLGSVTFDYEHEGLVMAADALTAEFVPGGITVSMTLGELPTETTGTMVLEMVESALQDPATFEQTLELAMGFLFLGLQQSLIEAGSTVELRRIAYDSATLDVAMAGELRADAASPNGAVGTITAEIVGLDETAARLAAASEDPAAQEMAMPLSVLQSMGERVEQDGTVKHLYVMELTPDGRTLLNGNDMGPMMDGLTGGTVAQ